MVEVGWSRSTVNEVGPVRKGGLNKYFMERVELTNRFLGDNHGGAL